MNILIYSLLEILGVFLFSLEGVFVKGIEMHPIINVFFTYLVYALLSFSILAITGKMNIDLGKKLLDSKFILVNVLNIIKTAGLYIGYKYLPISFAIVLKMMSPAFIIFGDAILNNTKINLIEGIGIGLTLFFIIMIYRKELYNAIKQLNPLFIIGVIGLLLFNIFNAFIVIKLPEYIKDSNPNEEIFLSTTFAFGLLSLLLIGLLLFGINLFKRYKTTSMLKMILLFCFTCYGGMGLIFLSDNNLNPILFSLLQYSQLILAFIFGYFLEGEQFSISKIVIILLLIGSIILTNIYSNNKNINNINKIIISNMTIHPYSEKNIK